MKASFLLALALIPGCLEFAEGPEEPGTTSSTIIDPDAPGIELRMQAMDEGGHHVVNVTAANRGSDSYLVSSICEPIFTHAVRDSAGRTVWPEPMAQCEAYGRKPFAPGAVEVFEAEWSEKEFDDEGATRDADPGTYAWTITMHVYEEEGRPPLLLNVTHTLRI